MFELCRLRCERAELHAPSSSGLDELLVQYYLTNTATSLCKEFWLVLRWIFFMVCPHNLQHPYYRDKMLIGTINSVLPAKALSV